MNGGDLRAYGRRLSSLEKALPGILEELIVGEGVYAVKQAKLLCKNGGKGLINTGAYRNAFHAGDKGLSFNGDSPHDGSRPKRGKNAYKIDIYNNSDYAKHLEYGFRSHFVPGHWEGAVFVYQKNDPQGGMYVGPPGGYVRGRFVLRQALRRAKTARKARLSRKIDKAFKEFLG